LRALAQEMAFELSLSSISLSRWIADAASVSRRPWRLGRARQQSGLMSQRLIHRISLALP
jgi:hypothetical protein